MTFEDVSFKFFRKLPAPPLMDENRPPELAGTGGSGGCEWGAAGARAAGGGGGGRLGSGGREFGTSWAVDTGSLLATIKIIYVIIEIIL